MLVGDARDLSILGLEPASVDCVITSPPYWHLKQYAEDDPREIGYQQSREEYAEAVGGVFKACFDLAKPTGVMWLVIDTLRDPARARGTLGELIPLPFDLAEVARASGWRLQDVAIWQKNKTLPYSGNGKLRNLIEYVLFLTKTTDFKHRPYRCAERHVPGAEWLAGWPERYHPLGRRPSNIWPIDIETQGMWDHSAGLHACPFPQDLVARCIDLTTDKGDVVLDPFGGIGTVCAQAIAMGRQGHAVELAPENVRAFETYTLSHFQASWEAGAESRRLARADQRDEAVTIFKLRLLKAGKELRRHVGHIAQVSAGAHPAGAVESVIVLGPDRFDGFIDLDSGTVGRPPAQLLVIADIPTDKRKRLVTELRRDITSPPFSTFGLEITVEVTAPAGLKRRGLDPHALFEFGQSRHGAYTSPIETRLFDVLPPLLTNVELKAAVRGDRMSELDRVRHEAERAYLQREVASGDTLDQIAARAGISQAGLHAKLIRFGLLDQPRSFAISLAFDQLALSAD